MGTESFLNNALTEKKEMEKQLKNTLPIYLELQLNKWVQRNLNENELHEIELIFPFKGRGAVFACEIGGYQNLTSSYDGEEKEEIKLNIKQWMKDVLQPLGHNITFFLQSDENIMITILNTSKKIDILSSICISSLNEFIDNLKTGYEFKVTIGLSDENQNIFDHIKEAFTQAITALSYKFYFENEKVIAYSRIHDTCKAFIVKGLWERSDLQVFTKKMQKDKVIDGVNHIFDKMREDGFTKPQQLKGSIVNMVLNQIQSIRDIISDMEFNNLKANALDRLTVCESFNQLKQETMDIILNLASVQDSSKKNKYDQIMKNCIQYVENHYKEDISLDTIAERFYFNPSYFGSMFKNFKGITLSQYLLKVRINNAKELLKGTNRKVYEIAALVGYTDSKYFIRVFKNEVGLSPDEYRHLVLSKKNEENL